MHILENLIAYRIKQKLIVACSLLSVLVLVACTEEEQPSQTEDVTRPVKTMVIAGSDAAGMRSFPARIAASARADLSFRIPGTVNELLVKEGDRLQVGDLVAALDPTDYQIVVNERRATFDKAKKNFQRAKKLVSTGAISESDYDRLEAEFKKARAALNTATQDIIYTQLKAPFDGIIATREVERFEEIRAKQTIVVLQNIEMLEVKFDVSESIIRGIRSGEDEDGTSAREKVLVVASFEGRPETTYPLTFKEVSTRADAKTQTFELTYTMKRPEQAAILPGMTALVTMDLSSYIDDVLVFTIPVSAVVGDYKLAPQVWAVDEANMSVSPRPVKVGRLVGNGITVLEGLEPGDRIVTAGAPFLVGGMRVTLLPELEQAEPRPEDLEYQQ